MANGSRDRHTVATQGVWEILMQLVWLSSSSLVARHPGSSDILRVRVEGVLAYLEFTVSVAVMITRGSKIDAS